VSLWAGSKLTVVIETNIMQYLGRVIIGMFVSCVTGPSVFVNKTGIEFHN
jgi:hypothetical protein